MGVKLGRWYWGRNVGWVCLRIGCWGMFGPKTDEVTGEWRKLYNEELNDLYSSPNIIRVIKSRRMRWARHIARMGERRGVYRVVVGKPEGKTRLEDSGLGRRIILRWIFRSSDVGVWTGSSWMRIGTGGVNLWMRYRFHKMRGISWLDEKGLASQEGLCSMV